MSEYIPTTEEVSAQYRALAQTRPLGVTYTEALAERRGEFDRWLAAHDAEVRAAVVPEIGMPCADKKPHPAHAWQMSATGWCLCAGVVAEEPEAVWQWSYVEKWVDDSGVYERVTFDSEDRARRYFRDNVDRVEGLNQEFEADDQIIASIEKRRTFEPGEWVPVKQEGAEADG